MMRRLLRSASAALALLAGGCSVGAAGLPAPGQIPAPSPDEVERVVFLVGDAGEAHRETHPILPRLEQDVEYWAERLQADSAVTVLFLGDIVYPLGLHLPGTPAFPHDSAVVMDQIRLVAGPRARERHAQGYFIAGNHDWGLEAEYEGFVRLNTLGSFLTRAREDTGANVRLVPEAGTGGPHVVDLGAHVRVLLLDTAWWLLEGGQQALDEHPVVLAGIERAMREAGGREVVIAAHHPFTSAGPHGGEFSFWRTVGVRYLLARSGAILQDLTSLPYRELQRGLRSIFSRTGPPLLFVGGHEHSLQVFRSIQPTDPTYSVVSGSASKMSSLGVGEGMQFGRSAPGYMRLVIEKDGGITLFVEASPGRYQTCTGEEPARSACMAEGVASFETVHSLRLR